MQLRIVTETAHGLVSVAPIDRIDSNGHYKLDNNQIVNKHINYLKGEHFNNDDCHEVLQELIKYLSFVTTREGMK